MTDFADIWSYLAQGPLLWLTATLIAYMFGAWLQKLSGTKPWVNPVLIAVAVLAWVNFQGRQATLTFSSGALGGLYHSIGVALSQSLLEKQTEIKINVVELFPCLTNLRQNHAYSFENFTFS